MLPSVTNTNIYLRAGEVYSFEIPRTAENNLGYSPKSGEFTFNNETREFISGFWVENQNVGEIIEQLADKVGMVYRHKLPQENVIWFESFLGHKVRYTVGNIPVHDHASIVTGGPAYATYYSDSSDLEDVDG